MRNLIIKLRPFLFFLCMASCANTDVVLHDLGLWKIDYIEPQDNYAEVEFDFSQYADFLPPGKFTDVSLKTGCLRGDAVEDHILGDRRMWSNDVKKAHLKIPVDIPLFITFGYGNLCSLTYGIYPKPDETYRYSMRVGAFSCGDHNFTNTTEDEEFEVYSAYFYSCLLYTSPSPRDA